MFFTRLFKISNFKRDIFFPKTKILLTSRNLVILGQDFFSSVNENPVDVSREPYSVAKAYYRQYLLKNTEYRNLFFQENAETNSKTADFLNQLELEKERDSDIKDQLYNYLNRELNHFTFDELCEATFLIMKFIKHNGIDPSWEKILGSINEQCLIRMSSWTGNELIKMTDVSMVHEQFLKFKNKLLYKLMKKSSSSHEIVFLFYFLIRKFGVPKKYIFDLQLKTHEILPEINSTEAGIIAEGYCSSMNSLQKPDLLYYILQKGIEDMESLHQIPFKSLCKFAKTMSNLFNWEGVPEFQKHAIETAVRFGAESVIQLARSAENSRYLDPNLQSVLMKEVKGNIGQLSLYHVERVTHINTLFNVHDEEFLKLALDIFEKNEMSEKNRKFYVLFLSHLIHYKIYPKNLLARIMDQDFVNNYKGAATKVLNTWWYIYCSLEIERPDYITVNLTPKVRNRISQRYKFVNDAHFRRYQPKLWRVKTSLENRFGEGTVECLWPLPHYSHGLVMRFDRNSKPQILPEDFAMHGKNHMVRALKDDHIWLFITWVYHLKLTDASGFVMDLIPQTQIRQLNAVGYTVLPVFKTPFKSTSATKVNLMERLESLIDAKLEECSRDQKGAVTS